jgi:hypothetical protein
VKDVSLAFGVVSAVFGDSDEELDAGEREEPRRLTAGILGREVFVGTGEGSESEGDSDSDRSSSVSSSPLG